MPTAAEKLAALSPARRAWIRIHASKGKSLSEIAAHVSKENGLSVNEQDIRDYLGGGNQPLAASVKVSRLEALLLKMKPADKAWLRRHYDGGLSVEEIAAKIRTKFGAEVELAELRSYLTKRVLDPAHPVVTEPVNSFADLDRRLAGDLERPEFSTDLSEAETMDRYIKPLFVLLGWRFDDPTIVRQNKFTGKGVKGQAQADLRLGDTPGRSIIVEAKAIGKRVVERGDLAAIHVKQFQKYAKKLKHRFVVFTNGEELIVKTVDRVHLCITDGAFAHNEAKLRELLSREAADKA